MTDKSDKSIKQDYWVLTLRAPVFLNIVRTARNENTRRLTYMNATPLARLLVSIYEKLNRLKHDSFEIQKVKPRPGVSGPLLHISSVTNDRGEVIIIDIHAHVLKIRGEITGKLLESFHDLCLIQNQKPLGMLAAFLGLKVGNDINSTIFLAHYAQWKNHHSDDPIKNTFILPESDWSDDLVDNLKGRLDRLIIDKKEIASTTYGMRIILRMLKAGPQACLNLLKKAIKKTIGKSANPVSADLTNGKIMVTYATGLKKNERNDIGFVHETDLDPSRLVIFFRYPAILPTAEELDWIKANRISCFCIPEMEGMIPGVSSWQTGSAGSIYKRELSRYVPLYLKGIFQCLRQRKPHSLWLLDRVWEAQKDVSKWKDFMIRNKITTVVHTVPSADNFVPSMAISELGGLAVEYERSIRFDYCTYIHNAPKHIDFVTGPYSLTQIPEPSFSLFTVQTGAVNVCHHSMIEEVEKQKKKSMIIVTVFDEVPNDVFAGDSIRKFYRAVLDLSRMDPRFFFLVKTKKPKILESLPDIKQEFDTLQTNGRCFIADWRVTPSAAAMNADFVLSVISTAAFESIILGSRTIIYYPMRSGCSILYSNNGLNRRIFDDTGRMGDAILRYVNGQDPSIGDCSDIKPQLDPFGDRSGSQRIGCYLLSCMQGFDAGWTREQVIEQANREYINQWGRDKITNENAFERYHDIRN
ncbi:MAG: hypothetical protein ACM3SY_02185 [Candidatus Omnitrophota bacterium]